MLLVSKEFLNLNICVYSDLYNSLIIDGNSEALANFGEVLKELYRAPDGYMALTTGSIEDGDITSLELCLTDRIPVICTKVYRGKPDSLPSSLIFPAHLRLGAFLCDVSSSACHRVSYSLMPDTGDSNETKYRVSDIICKYCGRAVSYMSQQDYKFLCLSSNCRSKHRSVDFDADDFVRMCRRRMRRDIGLANLCTVRAWRKGSSTVVLELTEHGIANLRDSCLARLLSDPEIEYSHTHFYHLASVGKLDYTDLQFWLVNSDQHKKIRRTSGASYGKYLTISWATCMNLRCANCFLTAENSWDVEDPTYKDYQTIPTGNSSCPRCRSAYYLSDSACYRR